MPRSFDFASGVIQTSIAICLLGSATSNLCAQQSAGIVQSAITAFPDDTSASSIAPELLSSLLSNTSLRGKFRLDFGSISGLNKGGNTSTWYLLQFDGKNLFSRGKEPTFIDVFKDANPTKATIAEVGAKDTQNGTASGQGSDPNSLSLRIESRQAGDKTSDANVLGNHSLFKLPGNLEIRGVAQVTTRSDFKQYNLAGGLETPTIPLLGWLGVNRGKSGGLGVVNWLFLGVQGENQKRPESEGGDQSVALTTYRSFIGKGFVFVESDASKKVRLGQAGIGKAMIEKSEILEGSSTGSVDKIKVRAALKNTIETLRTHGKPTLDSNLLLDAVKNYAMNLRRHDHPTDPEITDAIMNEYITDRKADLLADDTARTAAKLKNQQAFDSLISEMETKGPAGDNIVPGNTITGQKNWEQWIFREFKAYFKPVKDRASYELYAESSGWYYLNGHFNTDRFQAISSLNFKINFQPEKDDANVFFRIRYENGRERSSPLVYKNQIMASVGLTF